jgi:hypothetical protein
MRRIVQPFNRGAAAAIGSKIFAIGWWRTRREEAYCHREYVEGFIFSAKRATYAAFVFYFTSNNRMWRKPVTLSDEKMGLRTRRARQNTRTTTSLASKVA